MHSSIRQQSGRDRTAPRSQPESTDSPTQSSSQEGNKSYHDQFFDGRPTASLNSQQPGIIRTFSRSSSHHGQYDAETTPNVAYIERTASIASRDARRRLQIAISERAMLDETEGNEPRSDSSTHHAPDATSEPAVDRGVDNMKRRVSRVSFLSDNVDQDLLPQDTSVTVEEVDQTDERNLPRMEGTNVELEEYRVDYFGDSIEGEEALIPPFPPRITFRTRSPTSETGVDEAVTLFPTNPDPPSISSTQDYMPISPLPAPAMMVHRHPSYRYREPVQPATSTYPSPLRNQVQKPSQARTWTKRRRNFPVDLRKANHGEQPALETNPVRETPTGNPPNEAVSSHWRLYGIQAIIWFALAGYFFWRVSRIRNVVAFDCYELKLQLLSLGNLTLSTGNTTIGSVTRVHANNTVLAAIEDEKPASSIVIPKEFHARLKSHCVLQPVNRAVVLASHFEIWFCGMAVACGLAHLTYTLVLSQLRKWLGSRPKGKRALGVKVATQLITTGIASLFVAGIAWAMKNGW